MLRFGPAKPVAKSLLDAAEKERGLRFPPSYRQLLETWGPGSLCGLFRVSTPDEAMRRQWQEGVADRLETRKAWPESWAAIGDATFGRLVEWADTYDSSCLLWDPEHRDASGEHAIFLLGRGGEVAKKVADSLPQLVEGFLAGQLDRIYPPGPRGSSWELPDAWVTEPPPDLGATLLPALRAGDDAAATAAVNASLAARGGWEVANSLADLLRQREAEALEPGLRLAWLERASAWLERCAPGLASKNGLEALLAELQSGRSGKDLPFPVDIIIDPQCSQLTLTLERSRLGTTVLECTLRNTSTSPSLACVLRSENVNNRTLITEDAVPPLAPGETFKTGISWPESPSLHARVSLNPRSLGAPYGSYLVGTAR